MATASSILRPTSFPGKVCGITSSRQRLPLGSTRLRVAVTAQQQQQQDTKTEAETQETFPSAAGSTVPQQLSTGVLREEPPQPMARSKNMEEEYGGQWLSSVTRHVRIYAAYIDPARKVFDQTQTDKLTLLLDTTNEFIWTPEACQKVYLYFQELVDHYEGADLTEYTLRLIGSDLEHYIRKLLYDGEIKYNMDARVLNFSMGKPRVLFNSNQVEESAGDT